MMTIALWTTLVLAALLHVVLCRVTVRTVGKGADNGLDNAVSYLGATVILWWPIKWVWATHSWLLVALLPVAIGVALVLSLQLIYEVGRKRALIIAGVHTAVTSAVLGALSLVAGAIAAYVMYGRIISDPRILLRIVLRLIGIDPPF